MQAQEKYNVLLERIQTLSPYEAIYQLMDYQQDFPYNANIYYQLGNLNYDLLTTRDPLHQYSELRELLYRARLFYGNCLHFAKDQKLQANQYPEIPCDAKRLEYEQLENYIQPRLEEIKRQQTACDSIHNTFFRMVDCYNRCRQTFTSFLDRHTREKKAHLQLNEQDEQLLHRLQNSADSLTEYIRAFETALALHPIQNYEPHFSIQSIELYRLDGLTASNFLQNEIPLWDYSTWVHHFLTIQKEQYERLYREVANEYDQLNQQIAAYTAGKAITGQMDQTLPGQCRQLEYTGEQADALEEMQRVVALAHDEQNIATMAQPQNIKELMPTLRLVDEWKDVKFGERYQSIADSARTRMQEHVQRLKAPF